MATLVFHNNLCLAHRVVVVRLHRTTNTPTMPTGPHRAKKIVSSTTRVYSGLRYGGSRSSKVLTASQVQKEARLLEEKKKKEEKREFQRCLHY
jgi:hypothetical protein